MPLVPRSGKPKRSMRPKAHPRPPQTETVRVHTAANGKLRFTFTLDVLKKLIDLHMGLYALSYLTMPPVDPKVRYRTYRLEFARLADLRMPAVFVRIEPPTFDPHGKRIRPAPRSTNQFLVEIVATKLRIRHPIPPRKLELLWADQGRPGELNGLLLTFPDEDMDFTEHPDLPKKSLGISPRFGDLAVH